MQIFDLHLFVLLNDLMFNFQKIVDLYQTRKKKFSNVKLFSFLYVRIYLVFLSIINTLEWLLAKFIYSEIDQERMALHYNVDFGIDNYGETSKIFVVPFIGLLIIILNLILYILIARHKDKIIISHILFLASIITNCILLVSIALIYLVNFS